MRGRRAGDRHAHSPQTRGPWGHQPVTTYLPKALRQGSSGQNDKALQHSPPWRRVWQAICRAHAPARPWPPRGREPLTDYNSQNAERTPSPPPGKQVTTGILPWVGQSRETQTGAVCSISLLEGSK